MQDGSVPPQPDPNAPTKTSFQPLLDAHIVASSEQSTPPQPLPDALVESSMQVPLNVPVTSSSEQPLPPHNRWLPARYRDLLPEPPLPAVEPQSASSSTSVIPRVVLHIWDSFTTLFNRFSITCTYRHRPSHNPDSFLTMEGLSQQNKPITLNSPHGVRGDYSPPWPWSNISIWCLMNWKNTSGNLKSNSKVTRLVQEVLQALDFKIQDLSSFNASRETSWFDTAEKEIPPEDGFSINRWKHTTVNISVPTREKKKEGKWTDVFHGWSPL